MTADFTQYLTNIEHALKAGNATEHTHRPALKTLIESFGAGITAANEPKRIACGAPDYLVTQQDVTIGYIEAKDVGKSLDDAERSAQLTRYRRALDNLILTDYLEFRWYVGGDLRQKALLARPQSGGKLKTGPDGISEVEELLRSFLTHRPQGINTPKELAQRMARLTHIIRDIIIAAFESGQASNLLQGWREAFAKVLIADLHLPENTPDFADMFAQTLAYGLFTARVMDTARKFPSWEGPGVGKTATGEQFPSWEGPGVGKTATGEQFPSWEGNCSARRPTPHPSQEGNLATSPRKIFSRQEAQYLIPKSNPFLRDFFIQITGPQLDDEPFASFVEDLVYLLAHTDMAAVLADFGRRTKQEDPVVHFYETFLAAYDPKLRESRGVYYTPEPVVSYIVRSVDHLLKTRFNCPQGLADSSTITIPNFDPGATVKGKKQVRKTAECHKVLILDPAAGTGTFLYAVIDHIRRQFMQQGNAGMWPGYVKHDLLPRLFGFELLMAPYAVAHFKLSLQLAGRDLPDAAAEQWAYYPGDGERLGIYLTNALQEAHEMTGLPLFTQWVADETNAANEIKTLLPVLVVMGNPPYSYESINTGKWISTLIRDYYRVDGESLNERNPKGLQDDYVKFIRFGQWRIEQSGGGILAFISNNGYLDNPTFRGMRQNLMQTFTDIYILDLHGNAKKKETTSDGNKDENVFDIQQGVAIGIFIKEKKQRSIAKVHHSELWGTRQTKYNQLFEYDLQTIQWVEVQPTSPFYLFTPQDISLVTEYEQYWQLSTISSLNSVGIATSRDKLTIHFSEDDLMSVVKKFIAIPPEQARLEFDLGKDTRDWKIHLAQEDLKQENISEKFVRKIVYRPFDFRYIYYTGRTRGFISMPRYQLIKHMFQPNLGLFVGRQGQAIGGQWNLIFCGSMMEDYNLYRRGNNACFPLYLYPTEDETKQKSLLDVSPWPADDVNSGRVPNLNPKFVAQMARKLGLTFKSDLPACANPSGPEFGPEDVFHYIYAIFHSPTYRTRYAEFLKIDFPRVPLTADVELFRALCALGRQLVELHLLESPEVGQFITRYPAAGENLVDKGYPKYTPPTQDQPGRVNINKTQYFEGVSPEVWEFYIGGYQVLEKWLKDRRGRRLSYDELTHYQQVVVALRRTIDLMQRIDQVIPERPIQ